MMHWHELRDPFFTVAKLSVFWHIFNFLNNTKNYSFLLSSMKTAFISSKELEQFSIRCTYPPFPRSRSNYGLSSICGRMFSISSRMVLEEGAARGSYLLCSLLRVLSSEGRSSYSGKFYLEGSVF
jgi:hypothetical protein